MSNTNARTPRRPSAMSKSSAVHEDEDWHEAYASPELIARRKAKHLGKIKKLGILSLGKGSRILDVCCGQGEVLDLLSELGYTSLSGMDHTPEHKLVRKSSERDWIYYEADVPELPFDAESLDCVICMHSLHHLEGLHSIAALTERAYACLKKGGVFAVIDHYDSLQLRAAYAVLRSPAALVTRWTAHFRRQLIQEHDYLYRYLDSWGEVKKTLETKAPFTSINMRRDLFFFYLRAVK